MYNSVFDKRTCMWCTIGPKSFLFGAAQFSLFGPDGAVTCNYDYTYVISITINSLLIGSRCIHNGAHTNHC